MALWLKSEGYSTYLVNILPTTQLAVCIVAAVTFAIWSDYIRGRALVLCVCAGFGLFSSIVLAVWDVPIGLKWVAFEVYRFSAPYGPLSYTWAK